MPHVHSRQVQQEHHSKQLQPQQQHQANQAPSPGFVTRHSEQPQAVISPSSASSLQSQEQPSPTAQHQQQLQQNQPQQQPDLEQQHFSHQTQNENISQAPSAGSSARATNQNGEGRKISCEDIQLVQNLIERCLQLYMNQREVINTLLNQAKIEPGFTSLVWQKLEEQNADFFKAYYTRLKLKKHITLFNHLLEQQAQLVQKMRMRPTRTPLPPQVPSHASFQSVPLGFPTPQQSPMIAPGHAHTPSMSIAPQSPPLLQGGVHMADSFQSSHEIHGQISGITDMMEVPSVLHSSASGLNSDLQLGLVSAIPNGGGFPFNTIASSLDMTSIGIGLSTSMPLDTSFCTHDPHSQNGMSLSLSAADGDGNSTRELLAALGHIPRNFSLSDLTAELGTHSDLGRLGSYTSPFSTSETENFLLSPEKENYDDAKLLDSIEEPFEMEFIDLK
ncbi:hypothetical protein O6H91_Y270100 [Diphasiastrum complanatum]|nr:hypothetical protein O6H91_Y270100 [Diphasiastrum complanatum]KAJ7299227.1 hypothetical protein O6H91_Y270100 [Diphasiastrum complanatum]KAJ7299228.1 hypothetical protein O6H91_Y270100 [Diphasiastrum complanatum]KAJ7299229.1 hypothetical protein O6H91_Y270100 [Diphasiastrum complanatum]KAJ7299230.1 hypothetical protein O6H91_Y270100 [Diphasiastrum complanatum]